VYSLITDLTHWASDSWSYWH